MNLQLDNKTALVSGAATGIGLAIALAFLEEGAQVAITSRNDKSLETASAVLAEIAGPDRFLALKADVSTEAGAEEAVRRTVKKFGALDCLVANAGAAGYSVGWELGSEDMRRAFSDNVTSATNLTTAAVPWLIDAKGSITLISSIAALQALPAPIPYTATKAALHGIAKGLADDLAAKGVRVNILAPGNVRFPGGNWDRKMQDAARKSEIEAYIESNVPLKRFGKPEEIADAVLFLSSPRAAFITGASLVVDGGQTRTIF